MVHSLRAIRYDQAYYVQIGRASRIGRPTPHNKSYVFKYLSLCSCVTSMAVGVANDVTPDGG
jgi:hypothetical protein